MGAVPQKQTKGTLPTLLVLLAGKPHMIAAIL